LVVVVLGSRLLVAITDPWPVQADEALPYMSTKDPRPLEAPGRPQRRRGSLYPELDCEAIWRQRLVDAGEDLKAVADLSTAPLPAEPARGQAELCAGEGLRHRPARPGHAGEGSAGELCAGEDQERLLADLRAARVR
jgi:hypothetical protein